MGWNKNHSTIDQIIHYSLVAFHLKYSRQEVDFWRRFNASRRKIDENFLGFIVFRHFATYEDQPRQSCVCHRRADLPGDGERDTV